MSSKFVNTNYSKIYFYSGPILCQVVVNSLALSGSFDMINKEMNLVGKLHGSVVSDV